MTRNKLSTINIEYSPTTKKEVKHFNLASYCIKSILLNDNQDNYEKINLYQNDHDEDEIVCLTPHKKRKLDTQFCVNAKSIMSTNVTWNIFKEKLILEKDFLQIYSWLSIFESFIDNFTSYVPHDKLRELFTYIIKLLNDYKEIYIINKALECLNLLIKRTKNSIIMEFMNEYYSIYLNLYKYDFCKTEIYSLIKNLIILFHLNKNHHKENFFNSLISNNYKIKFQNMSKMNIFNEAKDDWFILKQIFCKFNIKSEKIREHFFEWLFLPLDNYIIENQQQLDLNASTCLDETEMIKTTQAQNVLSNMRLNAAKTHLYADSSNSWLKNGNKNEINLEKQLKFDQVFLYKTFICIQLISKNKINFTTLNIDEKIDNALETQKENFNLVKTLFNNYLEDGQNKGTKIFSYKFCEGFEIANHDAQIENNDIIVENEHIEIGADIYEKVELKLLEHSRFLSSSMPNVYELSFINNMIAEFFFQLNFIANVELMNKNIDLSKLKFEFSGIFAALNGLLEKCLKNEKFLSNKFILNTINLIINKLYFNFYISLEVNNLEVSKIIAKLFFSIVENSSFISTCLKIVFEVDNKSDIRINNDMQESSVCATDIVLSTENSIVITNFKFLSSFEEIFYQRIDLKIRLRLFSFLSYLSCAKYNYLDSDDLMKTFTDEYKLFNKINPKMIASEYEILFNTSIKLIFLINTLKYNYVSFDTENISIGMLKYALKQIKTLIKDSVVNDVYVFEIILKLVLAYSNNLIKIFKLLECNTANDDETHKDLKYCIDVLIVLIEEIYRSTSLNVDSTNENKQNCFDSIDNHRLVIILMSKAVYLISLTESNTTENNELFKLKYLHLLCDKSIQIRRTIIESLHFLFRNNESDFFNEVYENLTKLVLFYSQNLSENEIENDNENCNDQYKLIKKHYLNSLKMDDNLLNLRITFFNLILNLIKFPQCEFKCQFAIIHANQLMNNRILFNVQQLKYFVQKVRNYFKIDSHQIYFNYNNLILNWLSLDLPLNKFPFQIEYSTSFDFLQSNYEPVYTHYLMISDNSKKLLQIYNILNSDTPVETEEIKKICCKNVFEKIVSYIFNRFLINKKKNMEYCENIIEKLTKDLSLNLKELIKLNFSSILTDVLINVNQINFNINETKIFKMNILSMISFLISAIGDQKQQKQDKLEQNESQINERNDEILVIQQSTKLLTNLLAKRNSISIHNILFRITQSMLTSYKINDLIRFIQVYSVFIEYILFNNPYDIDNCLFTSSDQQIFLIKTISSGIINIISFYKNKLSCLSKNNKLLFEEKHKFKVLTGIHNLIAKTIRFTSKHMSKFDAFISECFWSLIELFELELEYYSEHNDAINISLYTAVFEKLISLLHQISKKSHVFEFICVYLMLLTKSKAIKDYLKDNKIRLFEESIDFADLFINKLKFYFNDCIINENFDNLMSNEKSCSISYLIKPLMALLENLNIKQLAERINKNNG